MARVSYLLDTMAVSQLFVAGSITQHRIQAAKIAGEELLLCYPTYYEVLRGLLKVKAVNKLDTFQKKFVPLFKWVEVTRSDWEQAAQFWAEVSRKGRQLSDMDLLIAAIASRLNAILVSADADFDALPIKREDWREPPSN
jgi:predicted nucleic acid-binding protein